jgi:hypothetical protein
MEKRMMPWKGFNFALLVFFIFTVFLPLQPAPAEPETLLKIAAPTPAVSRVIDAAGGEVVQTLRSCLLAGAPLAALSGLRDHGVAYDIVSYPAPGVSYFLLHSPYPSPLLAPREDIHCRPLEAGIWLLWTTDRDFRCGLLQPFRLKALDLSGTQPLKARRIIVPAAAADEKRKIPFRSAAAISDLVIQVSPARLRSDILALQNFKTRYASTPQCESAGAFILRRFQQMGLEAKSDPFTFETHYQSKNIVAVIPGKVAPERLVLACAHYDSISDDPLVSAPGADDNASGTAALLELAGILAGEKFDFSIGLLCVSAEEWGLYGSAHYARQARQNGAEIIAVINLDMIAYPGSRQRVLDVIANQDSEWLADRYIAAGQPHVGLRLEKVVDPSLIWSDHSSFWDQGYAALLGIEDSDNPYYHTTSDKLDTLDLAFAAEAVKASLAVVAELARPVSPLAAPTGLEARSQISAALFTSLKTVYLNWRPNVENVSGYHVYRSERSHGPTLRLTEQPIARTAFKDSLLSPGQDYFYVLTAVDEAGRESNTSEEVRDDENNG